MVKFLEWFDLSWIEFLNILNQQKLSIKKL